MLHLRCGRILRFVKTSLGVSEKTIFYRQPITNQVDKSNTMQINLKKFAVVQRCFVKKVFLEISPNACNFIKKETLAQVFSCEFCEISKNTFFRRTPLVAASVEKVCSQSQSLGSHLFICFLQTSMLVKFLISIHTFFFIRI